MIRNLKALGLALCAVFAFGGLSASASAEETDLFTSATFHTHLTGAQVGEPYVFSTKWEPSSKVECTGAAYTGETEGITNEKILLTPAYTGCKAAGLKATFDDEGCKFVLTGATDTYLDTGSVDKGKDAAVSLDCGHTGSLKVTAPLGCTITFKDTHNGITVNQNLQGIKYDNEKKEGSWYVKATVTIDKITYTSTGPCQALGITATDTDGFLTQSMAVEGYYNSGYTRRASLRVTSAPSVGGTDLFTSPSFHTYITGTQAGTLEENYWSTKSEPFIRISCTSVTYAGTFMGQTVEQISLTPSYTGCKMFGVNAGIDDEGCNYVLTGITDQFTNTNSEEEEKGEAATVSLDCGHTGQIRITGPLGCVITLSDRLPSGTSVSQSLQGIRYDNEESGGRWHLRVTVTIDGIAYTSTGPCQTLGFTATDADTFLTQTITLKAYEDAAHTKQVNLTVS